MSGEQAEAMAIRACREGRMDGLRELYERFGSRVHRTCYRILGQESLADEATQEIFLRVFHRIASFDGRALFSTWLYRVAVNQALTILKRERRQHGPLDGYPRLVNNEPQAERSVLLHNTLQQLTPEGRSVLVLRELEGLSYKELAEVLQIPEGTVMSRLSRAREQFRRLWTVDGGQPAISPIGGIDAVAGESRDERTEE